MTAELQPVVESPTRIHVVLQDENRIDLVSVEVLAEGDGVRVVATMYEDPVNVCFEVKRS